ncbi:hypothetical protein CRE_06836 [Caenorhabditis remanei]|uniref:Uncharacterized protein n=1 Tax=Caenorhabditis remanei TaxID=31234 RepID=E3MZH6_CAERE|nr:hypothetical protein CRE_06836 [Caenorhabditis remanei]
MADDNHIKELLSSSDSLILKTVLFDSRKGQKCGAIYVEYPVDSNGSPISSESEITTQNTKRAGFNIFNKHQYLTAFYSLGQALKVGKIDQLTILEGFYPADFDAFVDDFETSGPFDVKHLKIVNLKKDSVMVFMKNISAGLETIYLDAEGTNDFPFDELMGFPVFCNCKTIRIDALLNTDAVPTLVKKWIENDAEIDTKFQYLAAGDHSVMMEKLVETFSDHVVFKTGSQARIRTNSDSKHILIQLFNRDSRNFVVCSIISSTTVDSEYDNDLSWGNEMGRNPKINQSDLSWYKKEIPENDADAKFWAEHGKGIRQAAFLMH